MVDLIEKFKCDVVSFESWLGVVLKLIWLCGYDVMNEDGLIVM